MMPVYFCSSLSRAALFSGFDLIEEASLSFHARLFSFAEVLTLGKGVSDRTLVFEKKKEERQSYHDNVLICFCTLILYNLDC